MDSMKSPEGKHREGSRAEAQRHQYLEVGGKRRRTQERKQGQRVRKEKTRRIPEAKGTKWLRQTREALSQVPQRSDNKMRTANCAMVGKMEFYQGKRGGKEVEFCCEEKAETWEMGSVIC